MRPKNNGQVWIKI